MLENIFRSLSASFLHIAFQMSVLQVDEQKLQSSRGQRGPNFATLILADNDIPLGGLHGGKIRHVCRGLVGLQILSLLEQQIPGLRDTCDASQHWPNRFHNLSQWILTQRKRTCHELSKTCKKLSSFCHRKQFTRPSVVVSVLEKKAQAV